MSGRDAKSTGTTSAVRCTDSSRGGACTWFATAEPAVRTLAPAPDGRVCGASLDESGRVEGPVVHPTPFDSD